MEMLMVVVVAVAMNIAGQVGLAIFSPETALPLGFLIYYSVICGIAGFGGVKVFSR